MMRRVALVMVGSGGTGLVVAVVMTGWLAVIAGAGAGSGPTCGTGAIGGDVPQELRPIFVAAAAQYMLGSDGAAVLAGLTSVESGFGRNVGPSSAGAVGWTQFMPDTWSRFGVDANGDGRRDPYDAADAIFSAANYLHASGAPADWRAALFTYNHAGWYVDRVLARAQELGGSGVVTAACAPESSVGTAGAVRIDGGGAIVPIPGEPGQRIDERLLSDVEFLIGAFHVHVTAGYAPTGHKANGEHPLGLAVDLVPGPGGTWDDVDRLARWAEPVQDRSRPPFRWVGYDGDAGHGRGDHLHLSWRHADVPTQTPPASWVEVFSAGG
jgi:hypothetical protein